MYRKFVPNLSNREVSPEPPKVSKAPKVEKPHRTLDSLGALGGGPKAEWIFEDWQVYFNERIGIAETVRGFQRGGAEATAYEGCLVEWRNLYPQEGSYADNCSVCGQLDKPSDIILPYGAITHVWLHPRCWPVWDTKRRAEAEAAFEMLKIWRPAVKYQNHLK